jgi:AcrR family transcriptional regulator
MSDDQGTGIPRAIGLLWGIDDRPAKGPRPALTIRGIVEAAVEVADTEGVGALTMARIASQLGFTTMSLYRYVATKDELLMLVVDAATGPPPAITDAGRDWRASLTTWARTIRDAYQRRPWITQIPILGPPLGPNSLGYLDLGLAALAETGLSEEEKASTVLLLSGFVRNTVALAGDLERAEAARPTVTYGRMVAALIDEASHPALHRAVESGIFDDEEGYGEAEFTFGLDRILDGVGALVAERAAADGTVAARRRAVQDGKQAARDKKQAAREVRDAARVSRRGDRPRT